jgi:hypothetical protein
LDLANAAPLPMAFCFLRRPARYRRRVRCASRILLPHLETEADVIGGNKIAAETEEVRRKD